MPAHPPLPPSRSPSPPSPATTGPGPAGRQGRGTGGRHGRPRTGPAARHDTAGDRRAARLPVSDPPLAPIRTRLVRLTVLPAVTAAAGAWTAVVTTLCALPGAPGPGVLAALAGGAAVTVAALAAAGVTARRTERELCGRVAVVHRAAVRHQAELRALVESLRRGGTPPPPRTVPPPPAASTDGLGRLAAELARAQDAALAAVAHAARAPRPGTARPGPGMHLPEVFGQLARRLQTLLHEEIALLDELEHGTEDPDLLGSLFHLDHVATRMRRHSENLAVLGGGAARRYWSRPVPVIDVLRSAMAEIEQYRRIMLVPPADGTGAGRLRGHAVADVVHLIAELVENATVFSAPDTPVLLRITPVASGLAVEVEDRGPGLPVQEQTRLNLLLTDPSRADATRLLQNGRIGLYVVARLARRHGIPVRLQSNIYGGTQAVAVLPQVLLGTVPGTDTGTSTGTVTATGTTTGTTRAMATEADIGTGAEAGPDTGTGTATGSKTGSQPGPETGTGPETNTESGTVTGTSARTSTVPGAGADPRPHTSAHVPAGAHGQDAGPGAGTGRARAVEPVGRTAPASVLTASRAGMHAGPEDSTHTRPGADGPQGLPREHSPVRPVSRPAHVPVPPAPLPPASSPGPTATAPAFPEPGPTPEDGDLTPTDAARTAQEPGPEGDRSAAAAGGDRSAGRPRLPRRRIGEHPGPGPRYPSPAAPPPDGEAVPVATPELVARFRRGARRGRERSTSGVASGRETSAAQEIGAAREGG